MGSPGCPEFAFSTASTERKRTVSTAAFASFESGAGDMEDLPCGGGKRSAL
jgi:hypothetical protein